MKFDDYNKFTSLVINSQNPLALLPLSNDYKPIKLLSDKYDAGIITGIIYSDNTAFVTFETFTEIDTNLLYKNSESNNITGLDNISVLFNKLYKDLTFNTYPNVKNVVMDLSTNTGGAADALLYATSTLVGDVALDLNNPLSNGHNHQVYKADMNLDGQVDSNDKSLIDFGYNIYFIDSKYSFSSANAMPVLSKLNNPNVVTLGQTTGGGPCAVRTNVSPIGTVYASSSLRTFTKLVDNIYVDIDSGVVVDIPLTESQMIDRNYILNNISNWKLQ